MKKSHIAITIGDPAGVGPEIICKTLQENHFTEKYNLSIIGHRHIIDETFKNILKCAPVPYQVIEPAYSINKTIVPGTLNGEYGKYSMKCIEKAVQLAKDGQIDGICTCPIHKKAIQLGGYPYTGHTEFLGDLTNTHKFSMMLVGNKVKVILVTTHLPIHKVADAITVDNIQKAILNTHAAGTLFGKTHPKIAVCGLNPHAGDKGAIGNEERIIETAIAECPNHINVSGPYPADSLFPAVLKGEFDFVVVMYHDQGLIPVKMESFGNAVNVTLGLPIIRTSVDHGTAFDIAGKNMAENGSLKRAIEVAHQMVQYA